MFLVVLLLLPLLHASNGQLDYFCNNQTVEGDLQITVLLNKHYGAGCDKTTPTGTANPLGVNIKKWAHKTLPSPLSIGLRIVDTCGRVSVNTKAMCETVPWSRLTSGGESNEICSVGTVPNSIGVIATQPASGETLDYLTVSNTPLIVAMGGHHSNRMPTSIFHIGHGAEVVYQTVTKLMLEMKWDFITVVYSSDKIGVDNYETFKLAAAREQICIDQALPVTLKSSPPSDLIQTKGVVYLGSEGICYYLLAQQDLADKTWITTLDVRGLNINNGRVYSVLRSGGDLLTDALAIFGEALTMTVSDKGCNSGNIQDCSATEQFRKSLVQHVREIGDRKQTYTIDNEGVVSSANAQADVMYSVYNSSGIMLATISLKSGVTRQPNFQTHYSLCDVVKTNCSDKCGHLNTDRYLYIHGDYVLIVSLPIHKEKNITDRWSCTEFTKTGLFRTEAARFIFNQLRQMNLTSVKGKTFGMLVIDSCGDKLKTAGEVNDIIRGQTEFCDRNGNCLNHKSVVALIGDYSSSVTQQIQTILREKPLVQISYGASSVTLNNREDYPYFLRTNPPDDLQAHFMVELMKKINSENDESNITAANILYSTGLYGRTGAMKVKEALAAAGICLHTERKVNESGSNNFTQLVEEILFDQSGVKIYVLFLDPPHLRDLMDTISQSERYSTFWLTKGYSLILSDTWNDNQELLADYGDLIRGSFSFKFNADFQVTTFKSYLRARSLPTTTHENPWLSILDQLIGECKLPGNFLGKHVPLCKNPADITQYADEAYSLHLMKAITAAIHGLRTFVFQHEWDPFSNELISLQYDHLLRVLITRCFKMENCGNPVHPFTQKDSSSNTYGNGGVGYTIYNVNGEKKYVEVLQTGSSYTNKLGRFMANIEFFENGRERGYITSGSEHCLPTPKPSNETPVTQENQPQGLVIGFSIGITFLVLLGIALAVGFFLWHKNQQRPLEQNTNHQPESCEDLPYRDYLSLEQQTVIRAQGLGRHLSSNAGTSGSGCDNKGFESDYDVPTNISVSVGENTANGGVQASGAATEGESQRNAADATITENGSDQQERPIPPKPAPRTSCSSTSHADQMQAPTAAEPTIEEENTTPIKAPDNPQGSKVPLSANSVEDALTFV